MPFGWQLPLLCKFSKYYLCTSLYVIMYYYCFAFNAFNLKLLLGSTNNFVYFCIPLAACSLVHAGFVFHSFCCLSASVFSFALGSVFGIILVLWFCFCFQLSSPLCSLLCCASMSLICLLAYLVSPSLSSLIFIHAMVGLVVWLVCRSRLMRMFCKISLVYLYWFKIFIRMRSRVMP